VVRLADIACERGHTDLTALDTEAVPGSGARLAAA
jgi:hypothetical protein